MAVIYNKDKGVLVIEIETCIADCGEKLRSRKQALIDAISAIDEDRVLPDTIYFLTELLNDLELDYDQYQNALFGSKSNKDPKADWVKVDLPEKIK